MPPPRSLERRQDSVTLSAVDPVTVTPDGFVGNFLSAPAATGTIVAAIIAAATSAKQLRRVMQVEAAFHTAELEIDEPGRTSYPSNAGR